MSNPAELSGRLNGCSAAQIAGHPFASAGTVIPVPGPDGFQLNPVTPWRGLRSCDLGTLTPFPWPGHSTHPLMEPTNHKQACVGFICWVFLYKSSKLHSEKKKVLSPQCVKHERCVCERGGIRRAANTSVCPTSGIFS